VHCTRYESVLSKTTSLLQKEAKEKKGKGRTSGWTVQNVRCALYRTSVTSGRAKEKRFWCCRVRIRRQRSKVGN
jgi:hypothetical protein